MKWAFFIVYLILITVGVTIIEHRSDAIHSAFSATHEMPPNHLLQPDDISSAPWYFPTLTHQGPTKADLVGKYLTSDVLAGEVLRQDTLATVPTIPVAGATMRAVFPVERGTLSSGQVNASTEVRICDGKTTVIDRTRVLALICPSQGDQPCNAILNLSKSDLDAIGSHFPPQAALAVKASTSQKCE